MTATLDGLDAVWYAREHLVRHRAQLFLRMRMVGALRSASRA